MSRSALAATEFDGLMAAVGPFEASPRLAVGVSGGADSMALMMLAHRWAAVRGGAATALTVDHGLRLEAAAEARQVGRWLAARGMPHRILRLAEPPAGSLQAAARAARYARLAAWCRRAGVLHLLIAHNQEDQAETLLLRLGRGSGLDGLAAMAAVTQAEGVRIVRPLLGQPRARLAATLEALGQSWLEDPSNRDRAFARVRLRALLPALAREGLGADRLAGTARQLGRARAALEDAVAEALAAYAALHPAGYLRLRLPAELPREILLRVCARCLLTIGGGAYVPRLARLERLAGEIAGGLARARTLGGCRILPEPRGLLICREAAATAEPLALPAGREALWDGRFAVSWRAPRRGGGAAALTVGRLGAAAAALVREGGVRPALPRAVLPTLPALWSADGPLAVPHLGYRREGHEELSFTARFEPPHPLAGPRFTVA